MRPYIPRPIIAESRRRGLQTRTLLLHSRGVLVVACVDNESGQLFIRLHSRLLVIDRPAMETLPRVDLRTVKRMRPSGPFWFPTARVRAGIPRSTCATKMLSTAEILDSILESLGPRCLAACSRVSRAWNEPASRILWRELEYAGTASLFQQAHLDQDRKNVRLLSKVLSLDSSGCHR